MNALLDTGDEILIPSPDYPLWTACATLAGGTPVHYVCDEEAEWNPDLADLESKITSNTKAIVIINPNNPTGAVYPREVLEQIVEIARKHQLMIFSDEIYDRLCMDGIKHVSIASLAPDLPCVTFSGLSKSHMIAGYRIGWMILSGNKRCMRDFIYGIIHALQHAPVLQRAGAVRCADGARRLPERRALRGAGRAHLRAARVRLQGAERDSGHHGRQAQGGVLHLPKMDVERFNITDDEQFALDLLHEKRILITRGGGFNWNKPDHFRIVYLPRMEVPARGAHRLGRLLRPLPPGIGRHAACLWGPYRLPREMAPLAERRRAEAWCLVEFCRPAKPAG